MPTINAQTTPFAAIIQTSDGTGNLALQTANVTALNIDASQVVSLAQPLPIASGGTGQTTRQNAMDALAGAVTSGQYLRGNGTDVIMDTLKAADMTGIVAIANGGTNANTSAQALTNLGGTSLARSYAINMVLN